MSVNIMESQMRGDSSTIQRDEEQRNLKEAQREIYAEAQRGEVVRIRFYTYIYIKLYIFFQE